MNIFLTFFVLFILAIIAIVDAKTGKVPFVPLVFLFVISFVFLAVFADISLAIERIYIAILPSVILYVLNLLCVKITKHDAFGMGDIKFTFVIAFIFGLSPAIWSWFIGSWIAVLWIFIRKIIKRSSKDKYQGHIYVHFVPFLFFGLCLSLFFNL